jgi:glycosyltransferase involved in cell wall biosynthesis
MANSLTNGVSNNRRLVVVCQLFYPELVSTGQTLTELVEELSVRGLPVTVIAAQPTVLSGSKLVPSIMDHKGIAIRRTWSTRFPKTNPVGKLINLTSFFMTAAWEILRSHRDADLLLLTNPPYLPLLGWFFHAIRRQRFGVILFDIMPEQAESLHFIKPGGVFARAWRVLNHIWYRRARYVVVLSRDMLEGAMRNANLVGTGDETDCRAKTRVIHVWSDDRLIKPMEKSASREAHRLNVLKRFVVQYSGNHGRFHDLETLLGLAKTFANDPRFLFQFIGEGQKKALVDEYVQRERPRSIYSSTYVPKELLGDSLAMADLGVVAQMPGEEKVCYPSKLLGVMAAGRAVLAICPPACEMAQMIRDEDIGWVIDNTDIEAGRRALLEAQANPQRVSSMGRNASRLLREKFTLSQAADAYYNLITGSMTREAIVSSKQGVENFEGHAPAARTGYVSRSRATTFTASR